VEFIANQNFIEMGAMADENSPLSSPDTIEKFAEM